MSKNVKSFVSEKQIEEKRKARQEEWERVRKPDDPITAPEEEYDPRSLYERLKEQRDKKQEEFEEQLKFKNHFRGINREESEFLTDVSKRSQDLERQKILEEKKELEEYKTAVAQSRELPEVSLDLPEKEDSEKEKSVKKVITSKKKTQSNILKSAVKRKNTQEKSKETVELAEPSEKKTITELPANQKLVFPSVTKCVGILPGLAAYSGDSDEEDDEGEDDSSSDDDGMIYTNLLSSVVRND